MVKPKVAVLRGLGINCDDETAYAFTRAGASPELVHVNDLINGEKRFSEYQILAFPGGFSYGDDTGAGNALAKRMRNTLGDELREYVCDDNLVIGICNGFQVLANLGLVPGLGGDYSSTEVALVHNNFPRYNCRWVDLEFDGFSPWVNGLERMSLPVAHGEGKLYTDDNTLEEIRSRGLVALRYIRGSVCLDQNLDANPNGSLDNIAGISDKSGRILGMMPHPERAIDFTQLPNWTLLKERYKREGRKIPDEADGLQIFRNGVRYFE